MLSEFMTIKAEELKEIKKKHYDKLMEVKHIREKVEFLSIPDDVILENVFTFEDYLNDVSACSNCAGIIVCKQKLNGMFKDLMYDKEFGVIERAYRHCKYMREDIEMKKGNR